MTINVVQILPQERAGDRNAQLERVGSAYVALFTGNGSREDADLVLVDLAQFVRYYDTASLTADPVVTTASAHRRAVLQRILGMQGGEPNGFMAAVLTAPDLDETEENVS